MQLKQLLTKQCLLCLSYISISLRRNFFSIGCVALLLYLTIGIEPVFGQSFNWARNMGGTAADEGYRIAVDNNGNVYVTGMFNSASTNFNIGGTGGLLTTMGVEDAFLAKYDAGGNFLWAKNMGGSASDRGQGVAVDRNGNVYVTGYFNSPTANFNIGGTGGTLTKAGSTGTFDMFLAKYDASGNYLWAKNMGGTADDNGYNVTVDGNGDVYTIGYFTSTNANFNPGGTGGTLITGGGNDIVVAKYDASGNYLWAKNMGGGNTDYGFGVAADGNGNLFITGAFKSAPANLNPAGTGGALMTTGSYDVFLAKYDASGNFLWTKGMGGSGDDQGLGVAVDGSGNAYVTGYFNSATADFNPGGSGGTLTNAGAYDAFLAKYDAGGNFVWVKSMGGSGNDQALYVVVDNNGSVYGTGFFNSPNADFNIGGSGGALAAASSYDAFLAKYDAGGNFRWVKGLGGASQDWGYSVAADNSGNVYGTGYFKSPLGDFNPGGSGGTLTNVGVSDVFIVKFGCSDTSSSYLIKTLSCGESYTLNDSIYTVSGKYTQVFRNISGCDSTVRLDLTIPTINKPIVTINGFTLGVTSAYVSYQWIKDGTPISGATNSTYVVTTNGSYRVAVTNGNGCSDTSDVYTVTNVGIKSVSLLESSIKANIV